MFQAFGQSCAGSSYYRLPGAAELRTMLAHWAALVPHPVFDYTYSWGRQGSACPTLAGVVIHLAIATGSAPRT